MEPLLFGLSEQARRADFCIFFDRTISTQRYPTAQLICKVENFILDANRVAAHV